METENTLVLVLRKFGIKKGDKNMFYSVWQLPVSNKNCFRGHMFELEPIKLKDYVIVYDGEINSNNLEDIFFLLNVNYPDDYHARSLSVSDLICTKVDTQRAKWYYVDDVGFTELDEKDLL